MSAARERVKKEVGNGKMREKKEMYNMYGSVYVPYNIEREKNSSALIDNSHFQSSPRTLFPRSTYRPEFDDRQSHGFMILFFHFPKR